MNLAIRCGSLLLVLLSFGAGAQTRYISDELTITFRTGPSNQNAIIRNLTSGTRVQIIGERTESGWVQVSLQDGTEGWVLTQYLQTDPTAGLRLATATRELDTLRERAAGLEQQVSALEAELNQTAQSLAETETSAAQTGAELADIRTAAAAALETRQQNDTLRQRLAEMTSAAAVAELEIDELRRSERQSWFMVGAAVLFGGILIGLVAPSLKRKRRSSW